MQAQGARKPWFYVGFRGLGCRFPHLKNHRSTGVLGLGSALFQASNCGVWGFLAFRDYSGLARGLGFAVELRAC